MSNSVQDMAVELRLQLIERDIALIKARQDDTDSFIRQTQALGYKLESVNTKLDDVCEKLEKLEDEEESMTSKILGIGKVVFTCIAVALLIIAGLHGIDIPGL